MSYGQSILKILLYHLIPPEIDGVKIEILENKRPAFLHGLELDFYIPQLNLAFEFQGEQHYRIDGKFIKSYAGLRKRIYYDLRKLEVCKQNNIHLITIGGRYIHPGRFRKYMIAYSQRNDLPILRELIRKQFFKQDNYKKVSFLWKRVNPYLKTLGQQRLTNYSNRKPDLLIKMQRKEFSFLSE